MFCVLPPSPSRKRWLSWLDFYTNSIKLKLRWSLTIRSQKFRVRFFPILLYSLLVKNSRNYCETISMEFLVSAFLLFKLLQKILTVSKSFDFFGKMLFTYKTVTKNLFGQKLCNLFRLKHLIFGENQNILFVVFH